MLFLGRLHRVDLIKPVSVSIRPYIYTCVRSTYVHLSTHKKFFSDLNEIWYVGRSHGGLKVVKISYFKVRLLRYARNKQTNVELLCLSVLFVLVNFGEFW